MNTKDINLDERVFGLFKGDPGSGKSIAAASFPRPYFFDLDRRMKSVVNYWRPKGKEFEYDYYDTPLQVNKQLEEFSHYCPFKTLVYDGITTGSRQILKTAKVLRGVNEDGQRGDKPKRRMVAGTELSQIEDYNAETDWFNVIISNLKYISFTHNVNVIVTAHVLTTESTNIKNNVTTTSRSLLTGGKKVAAGLAVDFDEAWHFDVKAGFGEGDEPHYTIVTRNTGWDWAKTALPLPTRIDFTNLSLYDEIMKLIASNEYLRVAKEPTDIVLANPETPEELVKKTEW